MMGKHLVSGQSVTGWCPEAQHRLTDRNAWVQIPGPLPAQLPDHMCPRCWHRGKPGGALGSWPSLPQPWLLHLQRKLTDGRRLSLHLPVSQIKMKRSQTQSAHISFIQEGVVHTMGRTAGLRGQVGWDMGSKVAPELQRTVQIWGHATFLMFSMTFRRQSCSR